MKRIKYYEIVEQNPKTGFKKVTSYYVTVEGAILMAAFSRKRLIRKLTEKGFGRYYFSIAKKHLLPDAKALLKFTNKTQMIQNIMSYGYQSYWAVKIVEALKEMGII